MSEKPTTNGSIRLKKGSNQILRRRQTSDKDKPSSHYPDPPTKDITVATEAPTAPIEKTGVEVTVLNTTEDQPPSTHRQLRLTLASKRDKPEVSETPRKTDYKQRSCCMNYFRAILISVFFYFPGFYTGIMNTMGRVLSQYIYKIEGQKKIDNFLGNVNLFFCLGAALTFFIVGPLTDCIGRIRLLIISGFFSIALILGYTIDSEPMFYVVRTGSGIITGIMAGVVPVALSEMFPSSVTGVAGIFCYFISMAFMLLGWLTPFLFDKNDEKMAENHALIFTVPGLFGLAHWVLVVLMFRCGALVSPQYFLNKIKGRDNQSRSTLTKKLESWLGCVYRDQDVQRAAQNLIEVHDSKAVASGGKNQDGICALFGARHRFRFFVAVMMNICQQLSGINFFNFFST